LYDKTSNMSGVPEAYKSLPAVDKLLASPAIRAAVQRHGRELMTWCIRQTLSEIRKKPPTEGIPSFDEVIHTAVAFADSFAGGHLSRVLNATGIVLHTNLGRSPFSRKMLEEAFKKLEGYNNLELDLSTGRRGSRNVHPRRLLTYITGAEEVLVVNNAAAAVMLILRTFAKNREVVISRGELIEIGGSFRIPEIMAASDCRMVEVGTTNKTRVSDYENAICKETALLFKAHTSNFMLKGFTEETSLQDVSALAKKFRLPVLYDLGSGMIRPSGIPLLTGEPTVKEALAAGADVVCFSGDKLFGGPQAGIIAGRKRYIDKLAREPMFRALRVCKTTLALLEQACLQHINPERLRLENPVFRAVTADREMLRQKAVSLFQRLQDHTIPCETVDSSGQIGGGSFPDTSIPGFGVMLTFGNSAKERMAYAADMFHLLLSRPLPVLGILRKGNLVFDMLTLGDEDLEKVADAIVQCHSLMQNSASEIHPMEQKKG